MTTRLYCTLSLLFVVCLCTKKSPKSDLSTVNPSTDLSNISSRIRDTPYFPEDSITGKMQYIVIEPTLLFETPTPLISIQHNNCSQPYPVLQGTIAWSADLPQIGDKNLMPVYIHQGDQGSVRLFWIRRSVVQPLSDTNSVAKVCIDINSVQQLLFGAIVSCDTGLAAWALRHGASPSTEYTENTNFFSLAARSGNRDICTLLKEFTDTSKGFSPDRFHLDFITGDKTGFMNQIRIKTAHHPAGTTRTEEMSELFTTLLNYSMMAQSPKIMLRGFKTAFKMAPREALDTLRARTVWECIHAAVCLNDTASITFLLPYCAPWGIGCLYPLAVEPVRTNLDAVSYMLDTAEKQHLPSLRATYKWLLGEAIKIGDSSLCSILLKKATPVTDTSFYKQDLLALCCEDIRQRGGFRHDIAEPAVLAIARMLVEHGANVNGRDAFDTSRAALSPLFLASRNGLSTVAAYLASKGANVNISASTGVTPKDPFSSVVKCPLSFAIEYDDTTLMNTLLTAGASLSVPGCDLLRSACISNNARTVEMLVEQRYVPDSMHLVTAALYGSDAVIRYFHTYHLPLFNARNDNVTRTANDSSPLTSALLGSRYREYADYWKDNGRYERTVAALLDAGYRQDVRIVHNSDTVSPIDLAAETGRFDIVNFLAGRGAPLTPRVIRFACDGSDTALIFNYLHTYENRCMKSFPYDYFFQIRSVAASRIGRRAFDRCVADTLSQFYLRHSASIVPQLKAEITAWKAWAAKKDPIPAGLFGNDVTLLCNQLKLSEIDFHAPDLFSYNWFALNPASPAIPGNEPFIVNARHFSTTDGAPDTWFRHYNTRIIDACTRALDLPLVALKLEHTLKGPHFSNFLSNASPYLGTILQEVISCYDAVSRDSTKALAIYESYFRNPFERMSISKRFGDFDNPLLASFWTRRFIDGSASSIHALCQKLTALFPATSGNEDEVNTGGYRAGGDDEYTGDEETSGHDEDEGGGGENLE